MIQLGERNAIRNPENYAGEIIRQSCDIVYVGLSTAARVEMTISIRVRSCGDKDGLAPDITTGQYL